MNSTTPVACSTAASVQPSQRAVLDSVLSHHQCLELISIARALSVRGYRPGVASATIFDVAAAAPHLLLPLVAARERVREAVEDALGLTLGLLVEFTGLISWRPGSHIDYHADDCQPYLRQREWSAVCYLNSAGADFQGGTFRFRAGQLRLVEPAAGRMVAYAAREQHAVEPVTAGERFTLTLWLTTQPEANEDAKLLAQLAGALGAPPRGLPAAMYELPGGQTPGPERPVDLRLCRLACMGFGVADDTALQWYTDPEGGPLSLVVQLGACARWQGRQLDRAELGPRVLVCAGPKLRDVGEAALFVNWFALKRGDASRLSHEPVCCRHLRADVNTTGSEPSCCWGEGKPQSAEKGSWAEQLDEELRAAFQEWQRETATVQQQFKAKKTEWQRLGALF